MFYALIKKIKSSLPYLLIIFILGAGSYVYFLRVQENYRSITSFASCVNAGYPILPTYPEQCRVPGKIFTNPNQVREEPSPSQIATSTMSHVELKYLVDGEFVAIGSSSPQLASTNLYLNADLNKDSLSDTVFIASEKIDSKESVYYLLLALGLHSGELAAANGINVGRKEPQTVYLDSSGIIRVTYNCDTKQECSYKFAIQNDILVPYK